MTRRLIILGASARAAAFSAIRAGFEPYAIDCFADRDLAAVCPAVKIERYPGDFPAALAAAPDAPWIYTGGLENHPRLIEQMAALRPLWGNGGADLRNVRKPARLAEAARAVGIRFPRTQTTLQPGACETQQLDEAIFHQNGIQSIGCNPPDSRVVTSTVVGYPGSSAVTSGLLPWTSPD